MKFHASGLAVLLGATAASIVSLGAPATEASHAYFGDLHLHTSYSFDAFVFGVMATPDDAYTFAKGAPLRHPSGAFYQLKKPLDFLAVTDHAEYLGLFRTMSDPNSSASKSPIARRFTEPDGSGPAAAYEAVMSALRGGGDRSIFGDPNELRVVGSDAWKRIVEAANRHNEPGKFTAFIAYEFTSMPDGKNLHRNVIFRGDHAPQPFSAFDSANPEDLWAFLEAQRRQGIQAFTSASSRLPNSRGRARRIRRSRRTTSSPPFRFTRIISARKGRLRSLPALTRVTRCAPDSSSTRARAPIPTNLASSAAATRIPRSSRIMKGIILADTASSTARRKPVSTVPIAKVPICESSGPPA